MLSTDDTQRQNPRQNLQTFLLTEIVSSTTDDKIGIRKA